MNDQMKLAFWVTIFLWLALSCTRFALRWRTRRQYKVAAGARVVGFFHPFCAGGGGGERVLWRCVHVLARLSKESGTPLHVLVYTGDVWEPEEIISGVSRQFHISLDQAELPVSFVYLSGRSLLDATRYPVLTMLGQSLGSVVLAAEALARGTPDIFVDTTGWSFSFLVASLAGCAIGTYIHYPTISTDMLSLVREQRPSYNNGAWISSSIAVSRLKLVYYQAFALFYGLVGSLASVVMVNSSWTMRHIEALWKLSSPVVVFPPCDTSELETLPIDDGGRLRCVLSVGQFRPEKDHALQVRAFAALKHLSNSRETDGATGLAIQHPSYDDVRLVIVGSCRNDQDRAVLAQTRALTVELGIEDSVQFVVNCSFAELKSWLGRASVGLHTMWNEHFGIGVVEMMAAGLVTIAHRSGGPEADIVVPLPDGEPTGFLAETAEEYARVMARVFSGAAGGGGVADGVGAPLSVSTSHMRVAARESARRFSDEDFDEVFAAEFCRLLAVGQRSKPATKRE